MENPFNIPNEILIAFFQEFIRKTNLHKKSTKKNVSREIMTNYENIDIGLSFLKHDVSGTSNQDIVSILWVGCLPYLFPDEEIPVCLVMTTVNIFLFRIFLSETDTEAKSLLSLPGLQEAMHCFYSFPLKSLREIVVGLFDQGLRIEVADEGARGTFVFLTRDASKTGQFLDGVSSILGFNNEKELVSSQMNAPVDVDITPVPRLPSIVYPDENKIHALKVQFQEQELSPLDNRENLISYCIVYERRDDDPGSDVYDETSLPYLRSLILTNLRLILCEEDYVHWPLPSYVRSAPFTPQWIVDDVETVENVIGVELWEDMRGKQNMTGCYGVTIKFEAKAPEVSMDNVWNFLFQSISEREQFIRSVACLWKNNFDQDLKISYSKTGFNLKTGKGSSSSFTKGHAKKLSGNITIPATQSLDSPEMFMSLDRSRLNELFRNKISQGDDNTVTGVQYITCVGCKPYNYPEIEFNVAVILGKFNLYMISSAENRKYILANTRFEDDGGTHSLYINTIVISDLQQVVVGLFDQCFRLETGAPSQTFVFVTRNFDRTNEFIQRLSQAILALPKQQLDVIDDDSSTRGRTVAEIFQLYKREDESDENYYPKSEFVHPNSNIKIVYPSDETLEKLRYKILDYIRIMDLFNQTDDFGILLYSLIFQHIDSLTVPYTIVVSEKFVCLINEDHVNYPLPLFVKELPERPQYELVDVQLISSLLRIEFDDFNSGTFSLVFNKSAVDPGSYETRFQTDSVEEDVCLVIDVNNRGMDETLCVWCLEAHSYVEREKVFNILSKMWSNYFSGKTLSVFRKQKSK